MLLKPLIQQQKTQHYGVEKEIIPDGSSYTLGNYDDTEKGRFYFEVKESKKIYSRKNIKVF